MKMEDYEIFCKKHLARIQEEALKRETSFAIQQKNISLIQFHGVPVLSPLLSLEKKKEIQQYKQKALDLETWRQNSRKRALLNRVQEILDNVQIRRRPSVSDVNTQEAENTCPDSDAKASADFTALSDGTSACSSERHSSTVLEKTPDLKASDAVGEVTPNVTEVVKAAEENVISKQSESHISKGVPCPRAASPDNVHNKPASFALQKQEALGASPSDEEVQDPYVMSLQNLMKKSRESIEKEQTKRSSKTNSKRSMNESHSDKENDGVKTADSVKERAKLAGRSCTALTLDKPSLNKSNTLLQGASTHANNTSMSTLSSFSKVDIPMRVGTPPLVDSDSDEEFKKTSMFDRDSSIVRSLTGSYARLPSPEPSMSPKMHRRRPRPLSMGHIVINNPVNAYELSPKGKGRAMDLIMQDIADKNNVSESVPKFMVDFTMACPGRVPGVNRNSSGPYDGLGVGRPNRYSFGHFESKGTLLTTVEGQLVMDSRGPYKVETSTNVAAKLNEPFVSSQSTVTQKLLTANETNPSSLLENTKCNSPVELNKSYDVEDPSPLLTQSKNMQQQMDTPSVSSAHEQFLENSFEKVKRRLDLDTDNCQKENSPCVLTVGMEEQEKQWLQEQKYPLGSVYITKTAATDNMAKEEILKTKMLAFEEMRKRLEEQHAQQLSILIAEQEREQEKLQKELEEQERKLQGKKVATTEMEISKVNINSRMELEWRKKSESSLLESVQSQLETVHNANSTSIGFAHTTTPSTFATTSETSFFLWGPSGTGVIKTSVSRPSNRIKTRWTQVFSPEIQKKFDKITAVAKGFLTRRLLQTEKLKHLKQTVKDTMEFIKNFQSEAPLKRGSVSAQDASLHERVMAQLRAALYDIYDIFFTMEASERMNILRHDREVRKEKMLRQMDKIKSPRERVTLSTATQKSLDRKKYMKASEMGMPSKKIIIKQKTPESRVLQPNQGQNAPVHRLLCRQGTPKTSVKGVEQNRKKASESRMSNKAVSGAYAGRTQRKKPNVVTI
ncbi:centriolar coiled-coil protein of 110 kDa isoform X1 [Pezoporus flaviventris]|uniref:centriolar coiled-coil protein of 110 kDa isoform X1 n=1 Tax=Pezoporus flaviventris TaxID=889875 RepID=UPI002AAFFDDA|nr:centriolar coiled-coil protein of 110 kDa isoform X1 [Pezoporus flaviventris]XP_061329286.1 centriolar coiled-coil protein of 110 kDa isoform X1 [Pezoporus flaviventris]